ncbi:hypothetical protein BC827DRAFT_165720 [Russula dissimulans]|nr:hypothetical protein BC827DRAFT_165720 [Russula dissimulans]
MPRLGTYRRHTTCECQSPSQQKEHDPQEATVRPNTPIQRTLPLPPSTETVLASPRYHLPHYFRSTVSNLNHLRQPLPHLFPQAYQLPGTSLSCHGLSVPAPFHPSLASSHAAIILCRKIFSLSISCPPRGLTLTLSYIRTSAVPVWMQRTLALFHSPSAHQCRATACPPSLPIWTMATDAKLRPRPIIRSKASDVLCVPAPDDGDGTLDARVGMPDLVRTR